MNIVYHEHIKVWIRFVLFCNLTIPNSNILCTGTLIGRLMLVLLSIREKLLNHNKHVCYYDGLCLYRATSQLKPLH